MSNKRLGCILLAGLMAAGMITGCGSKDSGKNSSGNASGEQKQVTLTHWVTSAMQTDVNLKKEERFKEKYPNIKLENVMVTDDQLSQLASAFASGTNPDFGEVGQPDMAKYAYAGMAMELDGFMEDWDDLKNFHQESLDNFKYGGKQYALPSYSYTMNLFYNKPMFEEAGITEAPKTWDELLETAKKLTIPEKGQWGFNLLVSQWTEWWFEYFVWQAGGDLTKENEDGTLALTFDDPAVETAVDFYRQLIDAKVIQSDLTLNYENMQKEFANGHAAMTLMGSDGIAQFSGWGMKVEDIGMAELPVGPSGEKVTQLGGQCGFIFSNIDEETAQAAWTWLTFDRSKEETEWVLKNGAEAGSASPTVIVRNDVDISLGKINPEYQAAVDASLPYARLEFYGKGVVGTYVDAAVQKTVLDPDADVKAIFQEQQELAQKEAVDSFNEDILAAENG
ncbi:extracellular solute-binding protein [Massiliimalia timonensis]|uniref:extracellular solute-binding protein n=1 Tax=Massiliimalia timonensis TaxID=1987501 RepID=UPI00189FD968|nr:extracellular solute-binding protein [Massiliimalia timonensis]